MIEIDKEFIKEYLIEGTSSDEYIKRVEECEKIKVHSTDEPSELMLRKYQPSEPDWAIQYKKENWRGITKTHFEKIENVIAKIFRASDFVVKFENSESTGVADGQSLEDYTTKYFPKVKSLLYYVQKIWLRQYLVEPNGVTLIKPINYKTKKTNEYWRPYLYQICCEKVIYLSEEYLIIKEEDNEWLIVDSFEFIKLKKVKESYIAESVFEHKLGYVPAIYNGGKICLDDDNEFYYESVISGVCPWWSQALLEESDKNVAIKQHMHPEKAVYGDDKCKSCSGTGKVSRTVGLEKRHEHVDCGTCKGSGIMTPTTSSFGLHVVRPPRGSELPMPDWGPAKYIQKDITPLEFLDKDIDKLIIQGYAAVCMEQLAQNTSDKTESGVKKAYDWEQTNLFLYNIAVDICQYKLPWIYKVISDYRYGVVGQGMSKQSIEEMQPQINTPQRFDIIGVNDLKTQIAELKKAGCSVDIISELEKQLIGKEFSGDRETIKYLMAVIELDPLRNTTIEDKALAQASGFTNIDDLVVSVNIQALVQQAIQDKGFYDLDFTKQKAKIYELAKNIKSSDIDTIPINNLSINGGGVSNFNDVESEAKAKLKGTVGGVQGVLAIQDSVSKGITDYSAAVTLLFEIYGFNEATAKAILGSPKKQTIPLNGVTN
jgi:hypothetical protein